LEQRLEDNTEIEAFADDTIIKIRAKTIKDLEERARNAIDILTKWSQLSKLTFNASKTKFVLFTKNTKYRKPEIYLNNHKLEICYEFKHLGVILDSKLNWNSHCQHLKAKVNQILNRLLVFAKNKYGINGKALGHIYK